MDNSFIWQKVTFQKLFSPLDGLLGFVFVELQLFPILSNPEFSEEQVWPTVELAFANYQWRILHNGAYDWNARFSQSGWYSAACYFSDPSRLIDLSRVTTEHPVVTRTGTSPKFIFFKLNFISISEQKIHFLLWLLLFTAYNWYFIYFLIDWRQFIDYLEFAIWQCWCTRLNEARQSYWQRKYFYRRAKRPELWDSTFWRIGPSFLVYFF